jgi:hypothetical protein
MKKYFIVVALFLAGNAVLAQNENPVSWSFSSKKINATTFEIHLSATIDEDWHIYSQATPSGGPVPTTISFSRNPVVTLQGSVMEVGKMEQRSEPLFGVDVRQYSGNVNFVQKVTVRAGIKTAVNGTVEYMTCNDHECIPPKKLKFSIPLK